MDIKQYWKAYHAKNRDRINKARRYRYKIAKPTKLEGIVLGLDDNPIRYESKPEKVKQTKEPIVYIGSKLSPSEENDLSAALSTKEEDRKCCSCHLPGKHYARNRWFCDAHRP